MVWETWAFQTKTIVMKRLCYHKFRLKNMKKKEATFLFIIKTITGDNVSLTSIKMKTIKFKKPVDWLVKHQMRSFILDVPIFTNNSSYLPSHVLNYQLIQLQMRNRNYCQITATWTYIKQKQQIKVRMEHCCIWNVKQINITLKKIVTWS
jgi:hypothetical protein